MEKEKLCENCQYFRDPGPVDIDIPFTVPAQVNWCSNSQSPHYRTRPASDDSCDGFIQRGKKAPIKMRVAVKAMGTVNKQLSKLAERRHRKRKRK